VLGERGVDEGDAAVADVDAGVVEAPAAVPLDEGVESAAEVLHGRRGQHGRAVAAGTHESSF
jgi:hypothetical protein